MTSLLGARIACALLWAFGCSSLPAPAAAQAGDASPPLLPLEVSANHRFLVDTAGRPFFWLGDTAWELFHRLDRAEAELYLSDRAARGFTVIQAVALAELNGLTEPNRQGHRPLLDQDPARPDVKPGPANDYWDFVDEVVDLAAARGLRIGFLPTWGKYVTSSPFDGKVDGVFNATNALAYGRFLGDRYRDRPNLIWILGGDKAPSTPEAVTIWRALAQGIAEGVAGREDYGAVLMTYHTSGPGHVSDFLHDEPWLDFTSAQSSHGDLVESWRFIERHWARTPVKPVIDLESSYPDALIQAAWLPEPLRAAHRSTRPSNDDHARRAAYWAVFAGAFGHTYGHNSIWQMYEPPRRPVLDAKLTWREALNAPSATQMGHLRRLIESRPFLTQVPDQSLIAGDPGEGPAHIRALRGDGYALIYTPMGGPVRVRRDAWTGTEVNAWWFDPRTGQATPAGPLAREGQPEFTPPGPTGVGHDWVLALDEAERKLPPPGSDAQGQTTAAARWVPADKPRVFVLTDISNEPDDEESMVRFLVYANEYDLEGLVATTSTWLRQTTRVDLIHRQIDAYARVRENLLRHAPGFPTAEALREVTAVGQPAYGLAAVGEGRATAGSRRLLAAADRADDRPLWVSVWGGANTLAQALRDARQERTPDALEALVARLRVYTISDQDDAGPWLRREFPGLFYIVSPSTTDWKEYWRATWTGISGDRHYRNGPRHRFHLVDNPWLEENIIRNHGPLGALYPRLEYIMEGDTPSFLGLIDNGLGWSLNPAYGGWGGRYALYLAHGETRPIWTNNQDSRDTVTADTGQTECTDMATVWRWREHFQHDFAARMDWCVTDDFRKANHNPVAVLNGDSTRRVLETTARPGEVVRLSAAGTRDPDGDAVAVRWWIYPEASTLRDARGNQFPTDIALSHPVGPDTSLVAPAVRQPGTIHVILEVADRGQPGLFAYRRAIVTVEP